MFFSREFYQETKIGITVNKLRSNDSKEIGDLAKELVKKWKGDVGQTSNSKKTSKSLRSYLPDFQGMLPLTMIVHSYFIGTFSFSCTFNAT